MLRVVQQRRAGSRFRMRSANLREGGGKTISGLKEIARYAKVQLRIDHDGRHRRARRLGLGAATASAPESSRDQGRLRVLARRRPPGTGWFRPARLRPGSAVTNSGGPEEARGVK